MKSSDIRQLFLDFFSRKGHTVIPSSPLLPKDDPTLLFTNAGMVQFKSVFLGDAKASTNRAVTIQKCLRAGGKHNDLENVGRTARHHTFFEMLGNFSFGDYFKKEACEWAWEFLTQEAKLPAEKLMITVFREDDEAADIWQKDIGIPESRVFRLGEKDNFWQMGDTGPCGPCSEILIDQGADTGCGRPECGVGCDCDRFLEIWNLVFMQYNREHSGKLTPLPKPSIDTGMGLERLASVLQGKKNNFDSDLFMPIIRYVEGISGKRYGAAKSSDISLRVIADHIRSAAFVLSEGLVPSNEGRGYVLRRIIRRAARHGLMLGIREPFLHDVLNSVYEMMSGAYPELVLNTKMSRKVLKFEEERFARTLSSGTEMLDKVMAEVKSSQKDTIPGSEIFKLYDTFGFPLDLARDIAEDNGLKIDEEGFNEEMSVQKTKARASWVGAEDEVSGVYKEIQAHYGLTEFVGYDKHSSEDSHVIALIKDGKLIESAEVNEEVEVILDKTPFYGESGGQVGDTGWITSEDGSLHVEVIETKKIHGLIVHVSKITNGTLRQNTHVKAQIDEERRESIRRNHTATHLLHKALKEVLGDHVKQAGSLVRPDRLRFDFNHFFAMDEREISDAEIMVNEKIMQNIPVETSETSLDNAVSKGVVALFGEKYGEVVRVVTAGGFSSELCGGTHCMATGDIGPFKIVSEGSVAAGIRRIEALTGSYAHRFINEEEKELRKAAGLLKVSALNLSEKVGRLLGEMKLLEKETEKLKSASASQDIEGILNRAVNISDVRLISHKIDGLDMKTLRELADKLRDKIGSGIILLGSIHNGQASYVCLVTKGLAPRFHAGEILKKITGGKGGGRADMAQGGTKDTGNMDMAIASVADIIKGETERK
ncbi:MAG: alanine--tRNA ligase [Nitrospirae bacterium]|nr:alanine--tRNA ligase [Nitrospirota bacterium]